MIVRTTGSHWFIDNEEMRYMRVPLLEGPREEPWLRMSEGTVLEDLIWHPMTSFRIEPGGRLKIGYLLDGEEVFLSAPNPVIIHGPT